RVARPGLRRPRGEHVDMAVEHEVRAGTGAAERSHDVGPFRLRRPVFHWYAVRLQLAVKEGRRLARVARRVGARHAHEVGKEANELLTILVDPGEDRLAHGRHHCSSWSCILTERRLRSQALPPRTVAAK